MAEERKYYIRVSRALVEVTEEVYLAYYRMARREQAQRERDTYNGKVSYDALDTDELLGEELLSDRTIPTIEEEVSSRLLCEQLHCCLAQLSEPEQELLFALYFEGLSERELSQKTGVPNMTIHDRKVKVLRHLKKMMEN